jgi:hypothetical protein
LNCAGPFFIMSAVNRRIQFVLLLLLLLAAGALKLAAQGTAFNYQGRLNDAGAPANAAYDFRFAVYDAVTNGNQISAPLTNSAVGVSNGLFSVTLDFGPGIFTGTNYWLSIGVRTNGDTSAFTLLSPRQPILPVPYAIFAGSASNLTGTLAAAQLVGTVPSAQISGPYGGQVNFSNGGNNFSGAFAGNGGSLTNLNGSNITSGTVADARLSGNVALLNASQTFTGNNQFNGTDNFTNFGNSFSGSFFGNGLVGWIAVSGATQQAVRDHGYMLTGSGLTTVTLPTNSGLTNGDIVRVSGAGGGGWLVAENSGQSILGNFASYANSDALRLLAAGSATVYQDVAASADGTRIYYVGNDATGIEVSSDSGHTFGQITAISIFVYSIACSANGKIVYAEPGSGGVIKKSTDGGMTWSNSTYSATGTAIACSADGSKLFYNANYACSGNGTYVAKLAGGAITISTNGGTSFPITVTGPTGTVKCLAASSDCTRLLAGVTNGLLYATSNRGATWTALTATNQNWSGAWMSADGSKLVAAATTLGVVSGGVYSCAISAQPNTVSTNSTIGGSQGSAVELQYLGNGQFMPVSSSGLLWAN